MSSSSLDNPTLFSSGLSFTTRPVSQTLSSPPIANDEEKEPRCRLGSLTYSRHGSYSEDVRILTPNFIALTSRGAVPHLTQDVMRREMSGGKGAGGEEGGEVRKGGRIGMGMVYAGFEDYISRSPSSPSVFSYPTPSSSPPPPPPTSTQHAQSKSDHDGNFVPVPSPLRSFISLPTSSLIMFGPRRVPPISCPSSNSDTSIAIVTAYGFNSLQVEDYVRAVVKLKPDIALAMADIPVVDDGGETNNRMGFSALGKKRMERMVERTMSWTRALIDAARKDKEAHDRMVPSLALFASILPVERELQARYLEEIYENEEWRSLIRGLIMHDLSSLDAIPAKLDDLPRMSVANMATPHAILHAVSRGIDLFTLPILTAATDAGLGFAFFFPAQSQESEAAVAGRQPLAINLWDPPFSTKMEPLSPGCECYTCTNHHCAYVHHLLSAKEMLAWVLLQIHNHAMMDFFFAGVRECIRHGRFVEDAKQFGEVYESEFPISEGLGPRIRGYQLHTKGVPKGKTNPSSYKKLASASDVPPAKKAAASAEVGIEGLGEGE
ncbi:hypothetical protein MMC25_008285 [Agyrium rufum]|nr:hypothetical protein [Agyrium rufum]